MSKPAILILTEAGEGIGLGHYTRCSTIRKAAIESGLQCTLVVTWIGIPAADKADIVKNWIQEIPELTAEYDRNMIVLVDSYLLQEEGYTSLKQYFHRVTVIDDYNRLVYPADLLINPNVYFDEIDYSNQQTQCLGGGDFVILREFFRKPDKTPVVQQQKIVVMIGGSDPNNVLMEICKALTGFKEYDIDVICPEENKKIRLSTLFPAMTFYGSLSEAALAEKFASARIVISGCGQTLHELYAMYKLVIGIAVGADQYLNQAFYYKHGFLPAMISWQDKDLLDRIKVALVQQENKRTGRNPDTVGNCHGLINRNGVQNVVKYIAGQPDVTWRFASASDCRLFFDWANDKQVRANAFNNEPIRWENHVAWFRKKLAADSLMLIFFLQNEPVGQLRIDWEKGKGLIDLSVKATHRGTGLGSYFLQTAMKLVNTINPSVTLQGIVKKGNSLSAKAFEKAGFRQEKEIMVNKEVCYSFLYMLSSTDKCNF